MQPPTAVHLGADPASAPGSPCAQPPQPQCSNLRNQQLKVYPLRTGSTKVPYGQFYGGLTGWSGVSGYWRMATDKRRSIVVPIHAYLIEHPRVGPILVDTGISWAQAHRHEQYYAGSLHYLLDHDEYQIEPEQEIRQHLARFGYRPADVSAVILTHLHEDHVGGLRDLPDAPVVLGRAAWDGRHDHAFGVVPIVYQPSLAGVRDWQLVDYTSGPFHTFAASQDLFGDGTVLLLPTPGHGPGHQCVLVRLEGYDLLIAGDILYTLRHLAVDQLRALQFGASLERQQVDSIRRLVALRQALPDLVFAPGHDHTAYQFRYLVPFLTKGGLSPDDRQAIRMYEASIFDARYDLLPAAVPRFVAAPEGGPVGRVSEPELDMQPMPVGAGAAR